MSLAAVAFTEVNSVGQVPLDDPSLLMQLARMFARLLILDCSGVIVTVGAVV